MSDTQDVHELRKLIRALVVEYSTAYLSHEGAQKIIELCRSHLQQKAEPVGCVDVRQLLKMQEDDTYAELMPADFRVNDDQILLYTSPPIRPDMVMVPREPTDEMEEAGMEAAHAVNATVSEAVNRFLGWKLPENFSPDAGISFDPAYKEKWGMPIGTNLLNADQAKAMFQHCLIGKPAITEERVIDLKQKYTLSLPVVVQDEPEAHNVYLQVGNQRFCVTPMYCESLEEANHMRTMLANALANLLAAEGNKP